MEVLLTTTTLLTLTPVPAAVTLDPDRKLLPVRVTFTTLPIVPELVLILISAGLAGFTVKGRELLVPDEVVTLRAWLAGVPLKASVAVMEVLLTITTLLTVTPVPVALTVAPATKLVPVSVTFTELPTVPELGLMLVSVGVVPLTVNDTPLLVPETVVTDSECALAGPLSARLAVI